jgi:hypothetical protein
LNKAQLAIVRPDNPPPGVAGFVFDIVDDDGVELESDITDHYTEENNAVQDNIALHPEVITLSANVAEVVKATVSAKKITPTSNPLPIIPELTPTLSPGAESAQVTTAENAANLNSSITTTQSLYGYYQSRLPQQPNQTKQQVAFGYIYQLWKGRQTFSVETPWGFFTNMAIQSVQARQGPNTRFVSDFDITFKKIRTARSVTIVSGLLAGRATSQQAPTTQNGTIGQVTPTASQSAQFYQQIRPKSGG